MPKWSRAQKSFLSRAFQIANEKSPRRRRTQSSRHIEYARRIRSESLAELRACAESTSSARAISAISSSRQSMRASAVIQYWPARLEGCCSFCDSREVRSRVWPNPADVPIQVSCASGPQYEMEWVSACSNARSMRAPPRSNMPTIPLIPLGSPAKLSHRRTERTGDSSWFRRSTEPGRVQPRHGLRKVRLLSARRFSVRRRNRGDAKAPTTPGIAPGNSYERKDCGPRQLATAKSDWPILPQRDAANFQFA